jgi:HSP20 family protein
MSDTALQKANGPATAARADEADTRAVTVAPRVDILETDDEYLILADMPGVVPGDVDIRFENGELTVLGRRQPSHADKPRAAWEYEVASYFRTFRVTDQIAADRIEAELRNGVLTLRLPKVEAIKPRRIAVKG